jgi:hypothetical protein
MVLVDEGKTPTIISHSTVAQHQPLLYISTILQPVLLYDEAHAAIDCDCLVVVVLVLQLLKFYYGHSQGLFQLTQRDRHAGLLFWDLYHWLCLYIIWVSL